MTVPGTRTGTPGSTGTPAFPFDIQRMCGPDIGCTFPRCGIVPPFRIRRPVPDMADEAPDTVRWVRDTQHTVDLRAAGLRPVRQLQGEPERRLHVPRARVGEP